MCKSRIDVVYGMGVPFRKERFLLKDTLSRPFQRRFYLRREVASELQYFWYVLWSAQSVKYGEFFRFGSCEGGGRYRGVHRQGAVAVGSARVRGDGCGGRQRGGGCHGRHRQCALGEHYRESDLDGHAGIIVIH